MELLEGQVCCTLGMSLTKMQMPLRKDLDQSRTLACQLQLLFLRSLDNGPSKSPRKTVKRLSPCASQGSEFHGLHTVMLTTASGVSRLQSPASFWRASISALSPSSDVWQLNIFYTAACCLVLCSGFHCPNIFFTQGFRTNKAVHHQRLRLFLAERKIVAHD